MRIITLVGRVGREPDVSENSSGGQMAKLSLASDVRVKDKKTGEWGDVTEWFSVLCFGAMAKRAENIARRGEQLFVSGELLIDRMPDGRVFHTIMARSIDMIKGGGPRANRSGAQNDAEYGRSAPSGVSQSTPSSDDDIPY